MVKQDGARVSSLVACDLTGLEGQEQELDIYDRCKRVYSGPSLEADGMRGFLTHMILYDSYRRRHSKLKNHFRATAQSGRIPCKPEDLENSFFLLRKEAPSPLTRPRPLPYVLRPRKMRPVKAPAFQKKDPPNDIMLEDLLLGDDVDRELNDPSDEVTMDHNYYLQMSLLETVQKLKRNEDRYQAKAIAAIAQQEISRVIDIMLFCKKKRLKLDAERGLFPPAILTLARLAKIDTNAIERARFRLSQLYPILFP